MSNPKAPLKLWLAAASTTDVNNLADELALNDANRGVGIVFGDADQAKARVGAAKTLLAEAKAAEIDRAQAALGKTESIPAVIARNNPAPHHLAGAIGFADPICDAMARLGMTLAEARSKVHVFDVNGLLEDSRKNLFDFQTPYASRRDSAFEPDRSC